jgi:hypothetical protein
MNYVDYEKDYAQVWINLQAESKMLHHYCLKGDWETATNCALNCKHYAGQLANILQEMSGLDKEL